jgi:hypothetical protein
MKMIPASPHGTGSMAEKRVFDRLGNIFNSDADMQLTAYHSLNLTNHKYKRFGEIDFLIFGKPGLFVLEVKGGNVGCQKGIWRYTNRYGVTNHCVEGPFKQAESGLHGLMSKLRSHFSDLILRQMPIGYGVIFPDCEWTHNGAEWDNHTWIDSRSFNNLEEWLKNLFEYWEKKQRSGKCPDNIFINKLNDYLRPEFEIVETLFGQIGNVCEQVAKLTRDQMAFVDIIDANNKALCSGGAGTGKTLLAMELARRWTFQNKRVVLPCGSRWLKRYLETRFTIPGLTVTCIDALEIDAQRAGVDQFDAMIVDEGQDIFHLSSLNQMDRFLKGGLKQGQWCIFHDTNNQSDILNRPDPKAIDLLDSFQPARIPLNTNCRNTLNIINKVKDSLGADMGVIGAGKGPEVREKKAISKNNALEILREELSEIIEFGNIPYSSITILSPVPYQDSVASLLSPEFTNQINILDEFSMRNFPPQKISFAQILQFKGLENEAIIIIDLPPPDLLKRNYSNYYIAMSRPRAVLSIIFTAEF